MPTESKPKVVEKAPGSGFGVTAMVTGILAVLMARSPILSIPLGTLAIVFGFLGMRRPEGKGMAIAGLVTGIVGTVIGLAVVVAGILYLAADPEPYMPIHFYRY